MCERETERQRKRGITPAQMRPLVQNLNCIPGAQRYVQSASHACKHNNICVLSIRVVLMCVGDGGDTSSCMYVCFHAVLISSKVQDLVCVKPLGVEGLQRGLL